MSDKLPTDPGASLRILILDDEPSICFGVGNLLRSVGLQVVEAGTCAEALEIARRGEVDLAIFDYELPDGDALGLIKTVRKEGHRFPIVILTAHAGIQLAVQAIKEGAENFLPKPVDMESLKKVVSDLLEGVRYRNQAEAEACMSAGREPDPFEGGGAAVRQLRDRAEQAANTSIPILIQGDTGTGKGVLARWIHRNSPRHSGVFMDLNCAGLAKELVESQLFGHMKGAFTGAIKDQKGYLTLANRGSVFLDEIGDMDLSIQARLLKAVEERKFRSLGSEKEMVSDFRLIAATHRDLEGAIESGTFRRDLFYRLSTMVLRIPPLRERREDIPGLVARLLPTIASDLGRPSCRVTQEAVLRLQAHDWPGNIRELRNALERGVILARRYLIDANDLELGIPAIRPPDHVREESLDAIEKAHILRILKRTNNDFAAAAGILGMGRTTLYDRVRAWKQDPGLADNQRQ